MSSCGHDEPRIALSASRLPLPRATRMDATAMVDGWYSTELIAARQNKAQFHGRNPTPWNGMKCMGGGGKRSNL